MNSSSATMELSVAYLGWINDQLRVDVEWQETTVRRRHKTSAVRRFVVAGVACISLALAQIISS